MIYPFYRLLPQFLLRLAAYMSTYDYITFIYFVKFFHMLFGACVLVQEEREYMEHMRLMFSLITIGPVAADSEIREIWLQDTMTLWLPKTDTIRCPTIQIDGLRYYWIIY